MGEAKRRKLVGDHPPKTQTRQKNTQAKMRNLLNLGDDPMVSVMAMMMSPPAEGHRVDRTTPAAKEV